MNTVKSNTLSNKQLYHISFDDKLGGRWVPMLPAGTELGEGKYPEVKIPRISVSPTVDDCFRAVYPNVYRFFETMNYPTMTFAVYSPVFKGTERIVLTEELTCAKLVWDAHVTNEILILDNVEMVLVGEVTFANTNKSITKTTHPFNDKSLPKESVGPAKITGRFKEYPREGK